MRFFVVEDDKQIKTQTIDDCLASLGCASDWATNQQKANELLAVHEYDLILLDLGIPSCPGGKDLPDYGANLLKQIRARTQKRVPVVLMTARYQQCVDLMAELSELGIDGSISKPFSTTGRTLLTVIQDVLNKQACSRSSSILKKAHDSVYPFAGGVMTFYSNHVDLCDETIAEVSARGHSWSILNLLKEKNAKGRFVCMSSERLRCRIYPEISQNAVIQAVKSLRRTITDVLMERLSCDCGNEDVVARCRRGYHLKEWIMIEDSDDIAA